MLSYQVACSAVTSEEAVSSKHQTTPQEGANAANHHWVLKQGQDLRQTMPLAVWFRESPCLRVWNRKQKKSNKKSWQLLFFAVVSLHRWQSKIFHSCPCAHWWQIHGSHSAFLLQLHSLLLQWSSTVFLAGEQRCQGCVGHYSLSSFDRAALQPPHTTPGKAICMLKRPGITDASFIKYLTGLTQIR